MNIVRNLSIVLTLLLLILASGAQAQKSSTKVTVKFTGEKAVVHKSLTSGQVSKQIADFLRDKRDGVLSLQETSEKEVTRFEKSGDTTRMVREAKTDYFFEMVVGARERGLLTSCKSNLKNYGTASEMWATDYNGKYPENMEELTPNYLRTLPKCPTTETEYTYRRVKLQGYDAYEFSCTGDHSSRGVAKGFPKYNGIEGLVVAHSKVDLPTDGVGILTACKSNLKNYGTAAEMWSTDYSGAYPEKIEQLTPDYLRKLPTCPSNASKYTYRRVKLEGHALYEFTCTGDHSGLEVPKGYPKYNGLEGLREKP